MSNESDAAWALELRTKDGLSYESIANTIGKPITWVKAVIGSDKVPDPTYTQEQKDRACDWLEEHSWSSLKAKWPDRAKSVYRWRQERAERLRPRTVGPHMNPTLMMLAGAHRE